MIKIILKRIFLIFLFLITTFSLYADNIAIVYTGNTYSRLYPGRNVSENIAVGGLARRSYKIKQLKKIYPHLLLIDAGNISPALSSLGEKFDKTREKEKTLFYWRLLDKIGYRFVALGESELNFGVDFLKQQLGKYKFKFVSSNLKLKGVLPYALYELSSYKVAILGISPLSLRKYSLSVEDYLPSLKKVLKEIEGKYSLLILLSAIGEKDTEEVLKQLPRIDFAFVSGKTSPSSRYKQLPQNVMFTPSYYGESLRLVELKKDNQTWRWNFLEFSLKNVEEDLSLKQEIPACFSNKDCPSYEGLVSLCNNPGKGNSFCQYYSVNKFTSIVIGDKNCPFCRSDLTKKFLKSKFLGISFRDLDYRSPEAKALISRYKIDTLPAFIIPKIAQKEPQFESISKFLKDKKDNFLLDRKISGIFLFLSRKEIKRRIDLFISFYNPSSFDIFKNLKTLLEEVPFKLEIHFLKGKNNQVSWYEDEEIKIALLVKKLYPEKFLAFLEHRLKNIKNLSWPESLESVNIRYQQFKRKKEKVDIKSLEETNNKLAKELFIKGGNAILINNRYLFQVFKINLEEIKSFFK